MNTKLILYHGSNCDFHTVDLSKAKDKRDFGKGFYMTTLHVQAKYWAELLFTIHGGDGIYVYEFEFKMATNLFVKQFTNTTDWLVFVKNNRIKGERHNFDIVRGGLADDKESSIVLALFIGDVYSIDETQRKIIYSKLNSQVSIHTEKALSYLRLINKTVYKSI